MAPTCSPHCWNLDFSFKDLAPFLTPSHFLALLSRKRSLFPCLIPSLLPQLPFKPSLDPGHCFPPAGKEGGPAFRCGCGVPGNPHLSLHTRTVTLPSTALAWLSCIQNKWPEAVSYSGLASTRLGQWESAARFDPRWPWRQHSPKKLTLSGRESGLLFVRMRASPLTYCGRRPPAAVCALETPSAQGPADGSGLGAFLRQRPWARGSAARPQSGWPLPRPGVPIGSFLPERPGRRKGGVSGIKEGGVSGYGQAPADIPQGA